MTLAAALATHSTGYSGCTSNFISGGQMLNGSSGSDYEKYITIYFTCPNFNMFVAPHITHFICKHSVREFWVLYTWQLKFVCVCAHVLSLLPLWGPVWLLDLTGVGTFPLLITTSQGCLTLLGLGWGFALHVCFLQFDSPHRSDSHPVFTCPGSERLRSSHQATGEVQKRANRSHKSEWNVAH